MLDRIRAFFSPAASDQEVADAEPLWRIPEPELTLMSDPVMAGRPWEPGEVIDGLFEVLERTCGRIGAAYRLRHLAWGCELRARSPMLVYVSDPRARAALVQTAGKHAEMGVHPNLVATLGVRVVEDIPRILTEVPRGETLRERLGPSGLDDLGRLLDLGIQLCHGLEYAHQHQLTHQDLCAEVCRVDRGGTLRLDQFFPARPWSDLRDLDSRILKDRALPEELRRGLEGPVPASPLGVPPERWQKPGPATRTGNLYSLGVVLFQMATGRPPFLPYERHGKSTVASLKARVLAEEAPDARKFRPDLPEALAEVLASCLRRDPEQRPESAAAVAEALENAFRDGTGRSSPRPRFAPGRFDAENRNNAALMAFDRGREEEAGGKLEEALKADAEQPEARVNRALLGWRAGDLGAAEGLATLSGLAEELPAARRAELWLLIQAGEERRASDLLDQMEKSERSGWLQNLRGLLLLQEGSARQALTSFERAVAGEPSHWEFHHNLGICLNRTGERETALNHFEKAVSLTGHPVPRVTLALALAAQGKVAEARAHLEAALERDPESAWVHYHLGAFHASMGLRVPGFDSAPTDLDRSEQHLEAAVARAAGFYRARDALAECRRRKESDKPLPGLWEGHPTAPELHELGSLWTVRLVRVLSEHKEAVNALTMSWNGQLIVSAGHDDSILVWDPLRFDVKSRLRGHAGAVRAVSVSADNSTLASGSDDGTARLWQLPNGPALHTLRGHQGPVTAVALSPAGSVLLTGGDDRTLRVWEARTGDLRHVLEGHESRVTAVVVSHDGRLGVSAGVDRSVRIWELELGQEVGDLGDLDEEIYGLALSSDSRYLVTGGSSRVLRLWDLETGACLKTLQGHENEIRAVSLSPNSRFALSGGWDRTVRLWNVATGECIRTMSDHEHQITSVHACADGRFGLSGSLDRTLRMWEWKEELLPLVPGRPPLLLAGADRVYREEAAGMLAAGVLEEARAAMAAGRLAEAVPALRRVQQLPGRARDPEVLDMVAECTRGARRVGLRDGWCRTVMEGHTNWVLRVAWSPDGQLLASGGLDGLVALWRASDGENLGWLEGHGREVTSLDFSPEGTKLLSSSADRTLRYWDLESGQAIRVLRGHPADLTCGILSRNLPMALSSSMDGLVRVWNMENGEPLRDLRGHDGVVFSVGLCRTDRRAATGGADRRIVLWELPSGAQEKELRGHSGPVTSLSFCRDCARLLSGGEDRRAILWDLAQGEEILRLEGHEGAVRSVHILPEGPFLPEGAFMATASDDGRIRVWRGDGTLALALEGHEGPVRWARFSPDGRYLASAGNDRTLRIWELDWEVEAAP